MFLRDIIEIHLKHTLSLQEELPQERDPSPKPTNQVESQDEYSQFDFNWDDPTVLAALNSATELAPVNVPVPATTMQYTYQSLLEVRHHPRMCSSGNRPSLQKSQHVKKAAASPAISENIISAFENQRQQQDRTGDESVA